MKESKESPKDADVASDHVVVSVLVNVVFFGLMLCGIWKAMELSGFVDWWESVLKSKGLK